MISRALTVEEVAQLQLEHQLMKRALEQIDHRAKGDVCILPDAPTVPHSLASGCILALQGLAQAALAVVDPLP